MSTVQVDLPQESVASLCRKYGVRELTIFGSALREDFGPDSDVDFLAVFENDDYGPWMSKLTALEEDLSALLGRKVDLVPKKLLKRVIRDQVLREAKVVYAAA